MSPLDASIPTPGVLSIGALSRETGVPVPTIRTWERRYGFPEAHRKPSGHRVYGIECVPRIRRVSELLARGIRIGDAVCASETQLAALLGPERGVLGQATGDHDRDRDSILTWTPEAMLAAVARFDEAFLARQLTMAWGHLGPLAFVRDCVAPLVETVGDEWATGRLSIRHEHFLSERVGDVLRRLRAPLDDQASGPATLLATLPGERHGIGLQMVALLLNSAGCRVAMAGTDLPIPEIVSMAGECAVRAVGISASIATPRATTAKRLAALRRELPATVDLVVGGAGAPPPRAGITVLTTTDATNEWARAFGATRRPISRRA